MLVAVKHEITAKRLIELFEYEPETGVFRHRFDGYNNSYKAGDKVGASDGQGYLRIKIDGRRYRAHRLAWLYVHGSWPKNDIDHINGVRSDNRLANLRDVPRRLNLQNSRKRKPGAAGLPGVTPKGARFAAQIGVDGRNRYLGRFDTAEAAHEAFKAAKKIYHEGYVE